MRLTEREKERERESKKTLNGEVKMSFLFFFGVTSYAITTLASYTALQTGPASSASLTPLPTPHHSHQLLLWK